MLALITAVFLASLLGSTHCAGMCGAFVAFAVGANDDAPRRVTLNAAYNVGRLMTYLVLGAIGGAVGAAVDLGTSAVGLQRGAAVAAGTLMIGFALVAVLRHAGVRIPRAAIPPALQRLIASGHRAAFALPPVPRALAVGLLTTLLPCGWLYAFAITAAGTGSPALGAATMAAFWLGTLPMMAALGAGVQALAGPLRAKLPLATAVLLAAVGVWTIIGRLQVPTLSTAMAEPARTDAETASPSASVPSLEHTELPCCHDS